PALGREIVSVQRYLTARIDRGEAQQVQVTVAVDIAESEATVDAGFRGARDAAPCGVLKSEVAAAGAAVHVEEVSAVDQDVGDAVVVEVRDSGQTPECVLGRAGHARDRIRQR